MRNRLILAAVVVMTLATIPALGKRHAEIGVDGGWTSFDDEITNANGWRVGFRAGFYVWNWIEIEGQMMGSRASEDVGSVDLDTTLLTAFANGVFGVRKGK